MSLLKKLRERARDDRGTTLAELAVTTGMMSAVMAIFTTGVVQLFQASSRNELVATTQAQLNTAFLRLDRELRYASGIGRVHVKGSDTFVEYVNTSAAGGVPECAQLELYAGGRTLRRQVWPQATIPQNKWAVLASNLNVAASSFELLDLPDDAGYQRLRIRLVVTGNPGPGHTEATTEITFTALNSTGGADTDLICPEARL